MILKNIKKVQKGVRNKMCEGFECSMCPMYQKLVKYHDTSLKIFCISNKYHIIYKKRSKTYLSLLRVKNRIKSILIRMVRHYKNRNIINKIKVVDKWLK